MSCTLTVNTATAQSNGDVPIGDATYSWTDGAGHQTLGPANGVQTLTITGATSVSITSSAPGFSSVTLTCVCGTFTLFQLPLTGGGGTGPGPVSCFIVSAAYGTATAPEVELLQAFRDTMVRRTRWGSGFFDELAKHYYRVSPPIAAEMNRDPEMRRVLSFAIVEPWVNYIKLMMSRPDIKGMNLDNLDPKLREFLLEFQSDGDRWIKGIELPKQFRGRDPGESVDELNMVLGMVLLRTDGRVYLDDLEKQGELPLAYPEHDEPKLRAALEEAGRTDDEIASILHGAGRH